jgi:hypothetical protein
MRKAAIVMLAMSLVGCASQREYLADHIRPQRHVVTAPAVKPAPMPSPTPVVVPLPKPAPAKPLTSPRWYDEFKASGSWIKSKVKGN